MVNIELLIIECYLIDKIIILPQLYDQMKNLPALLLILICIGCKPGTPQPIISIALINNNQSLQITGFNNLVIKEIASDTAAHFESLVPVFRMPADTDMKDYQPVQPGHYMVKDSALVFTPDTPFAKHQAYFMRYFQYGGGSSVWDFLKGKKTASKLCYTDLIFKQ